MNKGLIYELTIIGMSFGTGVGLMMAYDLLRILRLWIPHSTLIMGVEDLIFWIYAALMTFLLLYELNEGILRGYAIAIVLAGMILYDRICSRFCLKLLKKARKYFRMRIRSNRKKHKQ